MERKIIVKNGDNYELDRLIINEDEFESTKYYIDNLPCMYNYLDGWVPYDSFEDCVQKLGYDYKKEPTEMSIYLNKILDNDNPLVVSDTFKKLVNYKPHVGIEECFHEGLLQHFSLRRDDDNSCVPIDEYNIMNDDGTLVSLTPITEEEIKKFGDFIANISTSSK